MGSYFVPMANHLLLNFFFVAVLMKEGNHEVLGDCAVFGNKISTIIFSLLKKPCDLFTLKKIVIFMGCLGGSVG